jgi:hypothetical protein
MQQNKTRQRQGRDFNIFNYIGTIGNADTSGDSEKNRDFLNRSERFKEEAERNAEPIDGVEPASDRSL